MVGGVRCIRPPLFPGRQTPRRPYRRGQPEREPYISVSWAAGALSPRLRQGQGVWRRGRLPRLQGIDRDGGRMPRLWLRERGRLERATGRDRRGNDARGGRLREAVSSACSATVTPSG